MMTDNSSTRLRFEARLNSGLTMIDYPTKTAIFSKAWEKHGVAGVLLWEALAIPGVAEVIIEFESTESKIDQGIWLSSSSRLELNGETYPSICLWKGRSPKKGGFQS